MSIAGGLHKALLAAQARGADTVQLFTASPQSWPVPPTSVKPAASCETSRAKKVNSRNAGDLAEEAVTQFHQILKQGQLRHPMAHDSYLINLASPKKDLFRRSVEAFVIELRRAEQLGLDYLVMHPGSYVGTDEATGLANVVAALDEVHDRCPGFHVQVLIETTAGQGQSLGCRFEHLACILEQAAEPERLGVCFDTCHVFAAGYPLAPEEMYQATMTEFNRVIGLKRLRAFHVNDSMKPLGSRVDRHAHIGQGHLGLEPFRLLVNDRLFRHHPMILETPKEEANDTDMDAINLATLRSLIAS